MLSSSFVSFAGFLGVCCLVASRGAIFRPTAWYEHIEKPSWTPPRWAFPVAWTVFYLAIAVAGWRVWERVGLAPLPFGFYGAQLLLNAAWSPCFFGLKRPDVAFADLVLLWLSIAGTILVFAGIDPVATWLMVPYLVWVTVAGALNWSIWRRNRGRLVPT